MQNQDNTSKEETQINDSNNQINDSGIKETDIKAEDKPETAEKTEQNTIMELETKATELNDKYLRLYSEFDNYRKRTNKERAEIIKTASEDVFKAILPVIDDLDRAVKANEKAEDITAIKEGIQLIYNKLKNFLLLIITYCRTQALVKILLDALCACKISTKLGNDFI